MTLRRIDRLDRIGPGVFLLLLLAALSLAAPGRLRAQEPGTRQAQATRAELEAQLVAIDQILASSAYSASYKARKRTEADMIRERLRDGDFQVGDQLKIEMSVGVTTTAQPINNTFSVGPGRTLTMPDLPEIPLQGVLRSELQNYLTQYLGRFFRDQTVKATPMIRLLIQGGVRTPGFYQLASETTFPDAIMAAGGPGPNAELEKSVIERGGKEIWPRDAVYAAINAGATLDQLNLKAGDILDVGATATTNWLTTLRTVAIIPGLILGFYGLGNLIGIF